MKPIYLLLLTVLIPLCAQTQELYFPPSNSNAWEALDPAELNYCPDSIEALYQYLESEETKSFILLKDGKIVLEQYFGTFTQDSLWIWFSAGKSLRALLVGIAQQEGSLDIHDPTSLYLGQGWTSLPPEKEDSITIWHQLTMTSGLNPLAFDCVDPSCLTYLFDAGERWFYHNGPYNMLKDVLEVSTGSTLNQYTFSKVRTPIGMQSGIWIPAGNNTFFFSRARDMARFGLLMQAKGEWNGTPILGDMTYYQEMINSSQDLNPSYGYLWWLNGKDAYIPPDSPISVPGMIAPDAPVDMYTAAGGLGQFASVAPSEGLVMIRQGLYGSDDKAPIGFINEIWKRILSLECTPTSSQEVAAPDVQIYPNPATDWLYIQSAEAVQCTVWDVSGKQWPLPMINGSIPIHTLPAGWYYLKGIEKDQAFIKSFVVMHR